MATYKETLDDFRAVVQNPANQITLNDGPRPLWAVKTLKGDVIFEVEKYFETKVDLKFVYGLKIYFMDSGDLQPFAKDVFDMVQEEIKKRETMDPLHRYLARYR